MVCGLSRVKPWKYSSTTSLPFSCHQHALDVPLSPGQNARHEGADFGSVDADVFNRPSIPTVIQRRRYPICVLGLLFPVRRQTRHGKLAKIGMVLPECHRLGLFVDCRLAGNLAFFAAVASLESHVLRRGRRFDAIPFDRDFLCRQPKCTEIWKVEGGM